MYTILVQDNNTLYPSVRTRIIKGSKNVDELRFLAKPTYNKINMTDLTVILTYILPVSKERKSIVLSKSEELYKERLEYKLLLNDENLITSESGDVKMWLTFTNGKNVIRYTTYIYVTVEQVEESDFDPDRPSDDVPIVDNIYLDKNTNEIYLTANGVVVGNQISINELSDVIVESSNDGLVTIITD